LNPKERTLKRTLNVQTDWAFALKTSPNDDLVSGSGDVKISLFCYNFIQLN
jgi:hypothetical protein